MTAKVKPPIPQLGWNRYVRLETASGMPWRERWRISPGQLFCPRQSSRISSWPKSSRYGPARFMAGSIRCSGRRAATLSGRLAPDQAKDRRIEQLEAKLAQKNEVLAEFLEHNVREKKTKWK
jgi:hypothetical protein